MKKRFLYFLALLLALLLPLCACAETAAVETDVLAPSLPILVNLTHPVEEDFLPADLVLLTDVLDASLVRVKHAGTQAVRGAAEALEVMLEAARADGIKNWQINTAYRSIADQEKLLEDKIKTYQKNNPSWSRSRAKSAALRTVAEPGCSEHHLGLAFDITMKGAETFKGTKQCKWLHANCWDYGFIVRYQADKEAITGFTAEEWHIRYVGVEHARAMRDNNFCLEEYLDSFPEDPELFLVVEEISLDDLVLP